MKGKIISEDEYQGNIVQKIMYENGKIVYAACGIVFEDFEEFMEIVERSYQ